MNDKTEITKFRFTLPHRSGSVKENLVHVA